MAEEIPDSAKKEIKINPEIFKQQSSKPCFIENPRLIKVLKIAIQNKNDVQGNKKAITKYYWRKVRLFVFHWIWIIKNVWEIKAKQLSHMRNYCINYQEKYMFKVLNIL